ncbi:hypothetical protein [Vreelandella aquamarina]|uniref:hypothetical protein n=1 Tax=Vreelandella aquamarina TaxID=77097 RepID=UPI00384E0CC1
MRTLRHLTLTLLLGVLGMLPIAQANETTWQALQEGGLVILMRHSLAPGIGDPPGFVLEACETQRNLSSEGRAHAVQGRRCGSGAWRLMRCTAPSGAGRWKPLS